MELQIRVTCDYNNIAHVNNIITQPESKPINSHNKEYWEQYNFTIYNKKGIKIFGEACVNEAQK